MEERQVMTKKKAIPLPWGGRKVAVCVRERQTETSAVFTSAQALTQMLTNLHSSGKSQCVIFTVQRNLRSVFF